MRLLGSALFRGIALHSPRWVVAGHRRPSGAVVLAAGTAPSLDDATRLPFVRGLAVLLANERSGTTPMDWSADRVEEELAGPLEAPPVDATGAPLIERLAIGPAHPAMRTLARTLGMAAISMLAAQLATEGLYRALVGPPMLLSLSFQLWTAALAAVASALYGWAVGRMSDMQVVYRNNAALLRVLALHARGAPLDGPGLRAEPSFHPAGNTSYILVRMALLPWLTWLVVSHLAAPSGWLAASLLLLVVKMALMPAVMSIGYELVELLAALYTVPVLRLPVRAVLFLQPFYVLTPTDDQLSLAATVHHETLRLEAAADKPPAESRATRGSGGRVR